MVMTIFGFAEI